MDALCGICVDCVDCGGVVGIRDIDCYHNGELMADDSCIRRRFFFFAKLSRPLSVFESLLSESSLDELELDDDDELDALELSDAKPVLSFKFTCSATSARAGSFSYIQRHQRKVSFRLK